MAAIKNKSEIHERGGPVEIRRRRFVVALGIAFVAVAAGFWRFWDRREADGRPQVRHPVEKPSSVASEATHTPDVSEVFPPDSLPVLLAVAEAIVPRFGEHPAASEIDLVPRLERCIALGPEGPDFFRNYWDPFEKAIRQRVPFRAGRPEPEALHEELKGWHREYARRSDASVAAIYFEGLRRNVLLAYYTSPAGWASAGYTGPARMSQAGPGEPLG